MHIMICDGMQYNAMQIQHGRNKMRHYLLSKEMWGKAFIYVQKREGVKKTDILQSGGP